MKLNFLIPGSIGEGSRMEDLEEIFNFYKSLIPDCTLERAKGEYDVWCHAWNSSDLEKPKDLITALTSCYSVAYTTIKAASHHWCESTCINRVSGKKLF